MYVCRRCRCLSCEYTCVYDMHRHTHFILVFYLQLDRQNTGHVNEETDTIIERELRLLSVKLVSYKLVIPRVNFNSHFTFSFPISLTLTLFYNCADKFEFTACACLYTQDIFRFVCPSGFIHVSRHAGGSVGIYYSFVILESNKCIL